MSSDLPPFPGRARSTYTIDTGPAKKRQRGEGAHSTRRTYRAHGRPGGRRWPRRVLISLAILIPLIAVAGAGGYFYVNARLDGIARVSVPALTPEQPGKPIDFLLIGSDTRSLSCVKTAAQTKAFGSSSTTSGQRSDTIIVARMISSTDQIQMLSIPRDTWVPIAGTGGSDKINAAFNSGPNQLVETIQDDFHIPINHVVIANFCGFVGMVNALGGVSLDFRYPVRDAYSGLNITTTGCQTIDGAQALGLVRSRHLYYYENHTWNYDGLSDWSRIRRQQAFFHALLDRLHGVIPNLFELNAFLGATVSDLTVDSSLSSHEMMSLGLRYHSLSDSNLVTSVLPTTPEVIDGQDALLAAQPYADQAIQRFLATGTVPPARHGTTGTSPRTTTTTTTVPSGVYTDTPQQLPEPWNPVPC